MVMDLNDIDLWLADCQDEDIERCRLILNAAEREQDSQALCGIQHGCSRKRCNSQTGMG